MRNPDILYRVAHGFLLVTRKYAETLEPSRGSPTLVRLEQLEIDLGHVWDAGDVGLLLEIANQLLEQGADLLQEAVGQEPMEA